MGKLKFQSPTGMHDILPEDQKYFRKISKTCEEFADFYGFQPITTPILEESGLFEKGTGELTDIIQKEIYSFKTKGGDSLALRPEGTPPVVRAYLEHGMQSLPQPVRLSYFGPFFRHDRPQAGRYRQFHHFGMEAIGEGSALIDAQIVQIFYNILTSLKLKKLVVEVNSIGDGQCRSSYKRALNKYLRLKTSSLCPDCKKRLKDNPLRILDCKNEKCKEAALEAPQTVDYLCENCHSHFKRFLEFLDEIGIPYTLNPRLVRGLDYYTKTVFEIYEESEEGKSQGTLAAGGRYDNLVKLLGGKKDTPACGGAMGVERIINMMKAQGAEMPQPVLPKIFLAQLGELSKRKSLKLLDDFRKAKIKVAESLGRDSLKPQLKIANKIQARYSLILGQKEALAGEIIIRDMDSRVQKIVKLDKAVEEMKEMLKKQQS